MILQESILCATAPPTSGAGSGSIFLHDIQTGATLASFKQTNAGPHSLAVLESNSTQGGIMLASQPDKSILNVYNFQKDQISLKIVLPEKLTAIALDRRGDLCAGGTATGRVYLWETSSGVLFNSWDAHYRQVNVLRFTNDGAALISGSDDSGVSVWSVSRLVDEDMQRELAVPYCTLSDHTLPVTDIICGIGLFPDCRVLTSSIDHSVKLWDLSTRSLLTTFQFPRPISYLAWDVTERLFFAASSDGSVHQMNLFYERESKLSGVVTEAIGGAGVTDIIRVDDDVDREARRKRLINLGQAITSMCISLTSAILLVGTSEGLIHLYDVPSHQLLRTISTHKGMSIAYLSTMIKPPDLIGHTNLEFGPGNSTDTKDFLPVKPIMPFQRMRDPKTREAHEISLILPSTRNGYRDEFSSYSQEEFLRDYSYFVEPSSISKAGTSDSLALKTKVEELESEVEKLRSQLSKAKGVNDAMWDTVVNKIVSQPKGSALSHTEGTENPDERRRKRGRAM
ncbi:Pre-rRNA-processing protein IPI3 [Psilocybe cubensis]|uniref:Pre-rRNA-processing protein IPI3 n=2 Tax=Psilocybe cubensis TaxID=181762 RepID=A0A8H7XTE3_PSICU|nr:Pre-rRNA-processing protein IPI3 [Psilocybe cubensis]KAH9479497.1 Pre-rRNA-processing protein IPI3 [Psilocybe cubensis]